MKRRRLTPTQRAVMAVATAGLLIRRRGSYGGFQADKSDGSFASSVTIDQLVKDKLLEPGPYFGTYQAAPPAPRVKT